MVENPVQLSTIFRLFYAPAILSITDPKIVIIPDCTSRHYSRTPPSFIPS